MNGKASTQSIPDAECGDWGVQRKNGINPLVVDQTMEASFTSQGIANRLSYVVSHEKTRW